MDENKSLWNKTTNELTVKDQLIICAAAPIITIGAVVAMGAVITVGDKIVSKFRKPKLASVTNIDEIDD